MGADEVIDYKTQTFENLMLRDYDAVFDTVAGEMYTKSFRVLKKGGIIVSMLESQTQSLWTHFRVKAIFQFTQVNRGTIDEIGTIA